MQLAAEFFMQQQQMSLHAPAIMPADILLDHCIALHYMLSVIKARMKEKA